MEIVKIPKMSKSEYDGLINEGYVCRISFCSDKHPYIAPFLYVFDGRYLYFMPTKYGRKINYFRSNPSVSVEVDSFSQDMSRYVFITLQGKLEEVPEAVVKEKIRFDFLAMIRRKKLSGNILAALGHRPGEPLEVILDDDRTLVWRLVDVEDIVALKNS
jgi:nitroimidazol reductase NimA-like FMN-containing flavoprotein (pyridoxamine 5'-phosphate oxidase superfamily)